jgi:putative FmdB family regulatory protein
MPTYDYHCARCGDMELFQSIKAEALTRCPECGSKRFERRISCGGGVIFKGSGFWETDYNRSGDYRSRAEKERGDGKAGDGTKKKAAPGKDAAAKSASGSGAPATAGADASATKASG